MLLFSTVNYVIASASFKKKIFSIFSQEAKKRLPAIDYGWCCPVPGLVFNTINIASDLSSLTDRAWKTASTWDDLYIKSSSSSPLERERERERGASLFNILETSKFTVPFALGYHCPRTRVRATQNWSFPLTCIIFISNCNSVNCQLWEASDVGRGGKRAKTFGILFLVANRSVGSSVRSLNLLLFGRVIEQNRWPRLLPCWLPMYDRPQMYDTIRPRSFYYYDTLPRTRATTSTTTII